MPSYFNGKFLCLTYPRAVNINLAELSEFLQGLDGCTFVLCAREEHQDGTQHFHAAVEFDRRRRFGARSFDFGQHHPNIQPARKWLAWCQYVKKDGNFVEWRRNEADDDAIVVLEDEDGTEGIPLFEMCKKFTREEWIQYAFDNKVPSFIFEEVWRKCHVQDVDTITSESELGLEERIGACLRGFRFDFGEDKRSLILLGESGCGKTSWAKLYAPKPALFVSHIDQLRKFKNGFHKSIIFDDMCFTHLPVALQIPIVDIFDVRSIHIRYGVATIDANVPRIFTCNEGRIPVDVNDAAIKRRTKLVTIRSLE